MNFEINPYKVFLINDSSYNCDINTINDECYNICISYGNVYGSDIKRICESKCRDILTVKKKDMGKTNCYLQRPSPPPIWNQVHSHFPKLLFEKGKLSLNCKERCNLDSKVLVTTGYSPKNNDIKKSLKKSNIDRGMKGCSMKNYFLIEIIY